jgi:glutamate carboxypeptidase
MPNGATVSSGGSDVVRQPGELLASLVANEEQMIADLGELVSSESPSADAERCRVTASLVVAQARRQGMAARVVTRGGRPHVLVGALGAGETWEAMPVCGQVLVLGHLDTVWRHGTLADWPFTIHDGVATGPGVYDMKAGVVQGLHALAMVASSAAAATMLVSCDEELGSPSSRLLIEELARRADAVLVLEPGPLEGVKIARKGFATWRLRVAGRAAHAGLEPERGINAGVELARLVLELAMLADPATGTTVVPTLFTAGSAANVVPESAEVTIDTRSWAPTALAQVEAGLRSLRPEHAEALLELDCLSARPPLREEASSVLLERARAVAATLGLGPLSAERVGGVSDGNHTSGVGDPTLDGLGAVGGGAHARSEHVRVAEMPRRAALVALLLESLANEPARTPGLGSGL